MYKDPITIEYTIQKELGLSINEIYEIIRLSNIYVTNDMITEHIKKGKYQKDTLRYYQKYIALLKQKCIAFLILIGSIVNKRTNQDTINKYDISINDKGYILSTDINRITKPFIETFKELITKTSKGNNLETYLKEPIDFDYLALNEIYEEMLYPNPNLQDNIGDLKKQFFIPRTKKQQKEKEEKNNESFNNLIDFLYDISYDNINRR